MSLRLILLMLIALPAAHAADVAITADSFKCLQEMTPVRGFYVDNLQDNLAATVKVAESPTGGIYPPGSVVQLFPNEVMVKREAGFNPVTRDWEFFELDVSTKGSSIRKRGFADVVNRFGGNCFACHIAAKPEWDMICEDSHGCEKLPIPHSVVISLQKADPRCKTSQATTFQKFTNWAVRFFTPL
ncbi:MAG: hypothetical protein ACRERR_06490 [Moraxellaceae bacterium]